MLKVDLQKKIAFGSLSSQKSNRNTVVVRLARAKRVAGWRTMGVSRERWRGEFDVLEVVDVFLWGKAFTSGRGLRFDSSLELEDVDGVGVAHLLLISSCTSKNRRKMRIPTHAPEKKKEK